MTEFIQSIAESKEIFPLLYQQLGLNGRRKLRLVCKTLRRCVDQNTRHLTATSRPDFDVEALIQRLPNLERITADQANVKIRVVATIVEEEEEDDYSDYEDEDEEMDSGEDDEDEDDEDEDDDEEMVGGDVAIARLAIYDQQEGEHADPPLVKIFIAAQSCKTLIALKLTGDVPLVTIRPHHWPNLKELDVSSTEMLDTAPVLALLMLTSLEKLNLHGSQVPAYGIALIRPGDLPLLKEIDLGGGGRGGNEFLGDDEGLKAMQGLVNLKSLEVARLRCKWPPKAVALIQGDSWPNMRVLEINFGRQAKDLAENLGTALQGVAELPNLEVLSLVWSELISSDIAKVTRQPGCFPKLRQLDMLGNKLSSYSEEAIAGLKRIKQLEFLNLMCCEIQGDGFSELQPGDLCHLTKLLLGNNASLAQQGCAAVRGLVHLTALRELGLHSCGLDADALSLIGPNDFPALQDLNLSFNPFGDDADKANVNRIVERISRINKVEVQGCSLSREMEDILKRKRRGAGLPEIKRGAYATRSRPRW